jgi:NADH-quinone oxidoreductase subunit J
LTIFGVIFYVFAALVVGATGLAVTRRDPIHAVIYLVFSFLGTAMLFYLLGAPFLAGVEVIIYAGAIMVLFLFVIMMLGQAPWRGRVFTARKWSPAAILLLLFFTLTGLLVIQDPQGSEGLQMAVASPAEFGRFVFERYWLAVEIVSLLLLLALVAAIQLKKGREQGTGEDNGDDLA